MMNSQQAADAASGPQRGASSTAANRFSNRFILRPFFPSSSSSSSRTTALSTSVDEATAPPPNRRSLRLLRLFFRQQKEKSPNTTATRTTTATADSQTVNNSTLFYIEPLDLNLLKKDEDEVNYVNGQVSVRNKHFRFDGDVLTFTSADQLSLMPNPVILRESVELFPLGKGSSSTVFAYLNLRTFTLFAVKETKILESTHAVKQAYNEISALRKLQQENIVHYYNSYIDAAKCTVNISMSYEFGGSVAQLILQRGALEEVLVKRIAKDVCSALRATHALQLAHCDIKPANILVSRNGESFVLCDFGLCRSFREEELQSFTGTTKYMSPERLLGVAYSAPADIWALGLVLCACAKGKYPVHLEQNLGEEALFFTVLQHYRECADHGKAFAVVGSGFSSAAGKFCGACLHLKPNDRPTAQELLSEYEWICEEEERKPTTPMCGNSNLLRDVCAALCDRSREMNLVKQLTSQQVAEMAQQFQLDEPYVRAQVEAALSGQAVLSKRSTLLPTDYTVNHYHNSSTWQHIPPTSGGV